MVIVRRIHPDEWREYKQLRLRALQDAPDAFGSTYASELGREDDAWAARIREAYTSARNAALFAESDSKLCGLAWCSIDSENPEIAHLYQMWVAPEARGQGAATQLLHAATEWAFNAGAKAMLLGVTVANSPAMRLYLRYGFTRIGQAEPIREGSVLLAQTMQLKLPKSAA
ncbi:MAG: GNAT family N-acetyltransferase [Acidihalobacter sp.]|jgi:ribosomal protein S18 acetylase RimI-like enzyme